MATRLIDISSLVPKCSCNSPNSLPIDSWVQIHRFVVFESRKKSIPFRLPGPEVRFWRLASTASAWTWKQATATLNQLMNEWKETACREIEREDRLVRGPVGQRKGEVLIPGRSRITREYILLNSGSETLKKVQEAMKSGKLWKERWKQGSWLIKMDSNDCVI